MISVQNTFKILLMISALIGLLASIVLKVRSRFEPSYDPFMVESTLSLQQLDALPNLTGLKWPRLQYEKVTLNSLLPNVYSIGKAATCQPGLRNRQYTIHTELLQLFADIMFKNGSGDRFFINGGTLSGSLRHHDLVPWDDDLNVLVDGRLIQQIHELIRLFAPGYRFVVNNKRGKLFTPFMNSSLEPADSKQNRKLHNRRWGWPFLAVGLYFINDTHVSERGYTWPIDMIFPLRFRPLGNAWYPAPNRPIHYLVSMRPLRGVCSVRFYHGFEREKIEKDIQCRDFSHCYAYVVQIPIPNQEKDDYVTIEERLVLEISDGPPVVYHTLHIPVSFDESEI